jgi:hypothetical protein
LQFVENSILVPRIMKGAIGLSPLTVFLAVLVGGQYIGPLGALLAIPFAAAIQVIVVDALRMRQQRFEMAAIQPGSPPAPPGPAPWRSILTQFIGDNDERNPPGSDNPPERPARKPQPDAPPESHR